MNRKHSLVLLLIAVSISFVSSQDIPLSKLDASYSATNTILYDATEGSMYRHVYTTAVYYEPVPSAPTVNSTLSINKTMIVGLFDTT